MIEGADRFHFQGACLRDYTLVLVFDEGLLTADLSMPGWGVMPPAQLLQCVPGAERRTRLDDSDASDAREGGSSSTASFEDSDDSDDDPDNLTASTASPSLSRSGSPSPRHGPSPLSSTDHTPGPSPRPLSPDDSGSDDTADDEEALHPPPQWLGWRPSDTPVHAARVTHAAIQAFNEPALDRAGVLQLSRQLVAGQLNAPAGPRRRGDGVMITYEAFGMTQLVAWKMDWFPAGHPAIAALGLTPANLGALVSHAWHALAIALGDVPEAERCRYLGHVEDAQARVLVFDKGLLVQHHAQARLQGWYSAHKPGRWRFVPPASAALLARVCDDPADVRADAVVHDFLEGHGTAPDATRFAALVHDGQGARWSLIEAEAAHGLIASGTPGALTDAQVRAALDAATIAPLHDHQLMATPFALRSGAWRVPVVLGAVRLLGLVTVVPGLIGSSWHETLHPWIERLLLAHRADETAWLAQGRIEQPIASLTTLMARDRRMRRAEVCVRWPEPLLGELFKTLAPRVAAQVTPLPRPEDVAQAVSSKAGVMLVFKPMASPVQHVVLVVHHQVWNEQHSRASLDELLDRVRATAGRDATERLAAMVTLA